MKPPVIQRTKHDSACHCGERGVTMVLVALAMIAIIGMAALSIDIITLYLAREEAQRSADAAALAAARVISMSGMTGDPNNTSLSWQAICGPPNFPATQAAIAVGMESAVGGTVADIPTVTYSAPGVSPVSDCSGLPAAFGINPLVTVQIKRANLPTFFSRIWGNKGNSVSASATAEAFNPSNSASVGTSGTIIPVRPRCVKPWIVPNLDPLNPGPTGGVYCTGTGTCASLVSTANGSITNPGISLGGATAGSTGLVGERFWLAADCAPGGGSTCTLRSAGIQANVTGPLTPGLPNLEYLPGQVLSASVAVPTCGASGSNYEQAIDGCDQSTIYECGVQSSAAANPTMVDLGGNPAASGDTTNGVQCLINQKNPGGGGQPTGQDRLNPYGAPAVYPFEIFAGTSNPLVLKAGLPSDSPVTSSTSIVTLPIYDNGATAIGPVGTTAVTIVGFLQVFINAVDGSGNVDVTVLNVAGCSNGTGVPVGGPISGTSPVPIRLITPP